MSCFVGTVSVMIEDMRLGNGFLAMFNFIVCYFSSRLMAEAHAAVAFSFAVSSEGEFDLQVFIILYLVSSNVKVFMQKCLGVP